MTRNMINFINYEEFFKKATEKANPYSYQKELAEAESLPTILNVPTGCGKTEAAILAWLWHLYNRKKTTPRRLVYCLPMRTLVEQTIKRITTWIKNLSINNEIDVIMLIGGNMGKITTDKDGNITTDKDWIINPGKNTIIVGTQDMLLSRALNRGYGSSPFKWPIEFGLVNNDCMWIVDEVQLMKNGLATTLQLEGLRKTFTTFGPSHTMWMSATVDRSNMCTVDFKNHVNFAKDSPDIKKITSAKKALKKLEVKLCKDLYDKDTVENILKLHRGKPTLIIVNNVKRARELFKKIKNQKPNAILVHSRFRPFERSKINKKISAISENDDVVIVSTQAIEAGVDISSHTMIVEIAPIPNMIQRFGRCNRKGEHDDANIHWIELNPSKESLPYTEAELTESIQWIKGKTSASSDDLKDMGNTRIYDTVLRKSDVVGLFDTSSDLSGSYLDVSRFVRDSEESKDVSVYWRDISKEKPNKDMQKHQHGEICNVPIGSFKKFIQKTDVNIWYYDYRNEDYSENAWEKVKSDNIFPGQVFLIDHTSGGYTEELGWDEASKKHVSVITTPDKSKVQKRNDRWISLDEHSTATSDMMTKILKQIDFVDSETIDVLKRAALFHDLGKSHHIFQTTLSKQTGWKKGVWAKGSGIGRHDRVNFRHEVASALVYLKNSSQDKQRDLVAFLIAAHHGKVRLSFRTRGQEKDGFMFGFPVDKYETLPATTVGSHTIPKTEIDMSISIMGTSNGQDSWITKTLRLLDKLGPFRLGYLEAILRIADINASKDAQS